MADIVGILLAAGSASRFGSDKLSHPLADGTPIALRSARTLREALPESLVVVRSASSPLAQLLEKEGWRVVECAEAVQGMGHTLAAGVRASEPAKGWVVALADMPFVNVESIRLVARCVREGSAIAAPAFHGKRGHPVGFCAGLRAELEGSRGDEGARALLRNRRDDIALIDVDDPGVLRDIDTPADLEEKSNGG